MKPCDYCGTSNGVLLVCQMEYVIHFCPEHQSDAMRDWEIYKNEMRRKAYIS